jgi:hypothetical protein
MLPVLVERPPMNRKNGVLAPAGHPMPPSDHARQSGSFIPQAVFTTFSDGAGSANADDPSASDYGTVDKSGS